MSHHGLGTPDVTKLSLAVLISNMIYCTRSEELAYRKECMEEINRRFPHEEARLLDAVKEDKSSEPKTQNFDVMDKDYNSLEAGWYIAKFIVGEVVEIRDDGKGAYVMRIGEERRRSLSEFKFIQRIMLYPNAPKEPTRPLEIQADFEEVWMKLQGILDILGNNRDAREAVVSVMNMFQNRAIIKDSCL